MYRAMAIAVLARTSWYLTTSTATYMGPSCCHYSSSRAAPAAPSPELTKTVAAGRRRSPRTITPWIAKLRASGRRTADPSEAEEQGAAVSFRDAPAPPCCGFLVYLASSGSRPFEWHGPGHPAAALPSPVLRGTNIEVDAVVLKSPSPLNEL